MTEHVEKISYRSTHHTANRSTVTNRIYVPWLVAIIFGVLWSGAYLVLGQMHGMWPMFNNEFPFASARLFTSQIAELSVAAGALFAFIDGAVAGLAGSWIIILAFRITSGI